MDYWTLHTIIVRQMTILHECPMDTLYSRVEPQFLCNSLYIFSLVSFQLLPNPISTPNTAIFILIFCFLAIVLYFEDAPSIRFLPPTVSQAWRNNSQHAKPKAPSFPSSSIYHNPALQPTR